MEGLKDFLNALSNPAVFLTLAVAAFLATLKWYRVVTKPAIAGAIGFLMIAFLAFGATDENLVENALGKPDNIPIPLMLASVAFFTWMALRKAAINDERAERGLPPAEADEAGQKVYTWPDLVFSELVCLLLVTALLVI